MFLTFDSQFSRVSMEINKRDRHCRQKCFTLFFLEVTPPFSPSPSPAVLPGTTKFLFMFSLIKLTLSPQTREIVSRGRKTRNARSFGGLINSSFLELGN